MRPGRYIGLLGVAASLLCGPVAPTYGSEKDAGGKLTARRVFAELPVSVLDILRHTTRLDMLDYYDADSIWQAQNTMGGVSELHLVTPDYLKVRLTPVSTLEIRILPLGKGQIAMTVYTIENPGTRQASDSQISFFSPDMVPLETSRYFRQPDTGDFIIRDISKSERKSLVGSIPFPMISYTLSPDTYVLTGTLHSTEAMPQETASQLVPNIKPKLDWEWTGARWRMVSK